MYKRLKIVGCLVSIVLVGVTVSPTAAAAKMPIDILGVLSDLNDRSVGSSAEVFDGWAKTNGTPSAENLVDVELNDVRIVIPVNSSRPITLSNGRDRNLQMQLVIGSNGGIGRKVTAGISSFEQNNGSLTVPIIKDDGSLQVTNIILDSAAPEEFEFDFKGNSDLKLVESSGQVFVLKSGNFAGALALPWARDALGRVVETHYSVSGTKVKQTVKHQTGNFAYPLVSDPWLGINLFSSIRLGQPMNNQPVVDLDLSSWGWAVYSGLAQGGFIVSPIIGQGILNTAGWDEAWGKGGLIRAALDKPSQREQFSCHALGALFAGQWNLEKFRLNRTNGNWGAGVAFHHCNWLTSDGY